MSEIYAYSYKEYKLFSPAIKSKLNVMLTFISDIICGGHKESYDFLIEWITNMAKGNKNASTPVRKVPMGLGKSTLPQFLSKYV